MQFYRTVERKSAKKNKRIVDSSSAILLLFGAAADVAVGDYSCFLYVCSYVNQNSTRMILFNSVKIINVLFPCNSTTRDGDEINIRNMLIRIALLLACLSSGFWWVPCVV